MDAVNIFSCLRFLALFSVIISVVFFEGSIKRSANIHDLTSNANFVLMVIYINFQLPLENSSFRLIFLIFFEAATTLVSILALLDFFTVVSGVAESFSHSLES